MTRSFNFPYSFTSTYLKMFAFK